MEFSNSSSNYLNSASVISEENLSAFESSSLSELTALGNKSPILLPNYEADVENSPFSMSAEALIAETDDTIFNLQASSSNLSPNANINSLNIGTNQRVLDPSLRPVVSSENFPDQLTGLTDSLDSVHSVVGDTPMAATLSHRLHYPFSPTSLVHPSSLGFEHTNNHALVGIIDTGFVPEKMDVEFSRMEWGTNRIDAGIESAGNVNSHGSAIANLIGAQQNNGDGIDGVNDQTKLWLGDAVGSGQWTESLIEFVDTAKASGQENAIANLSFDLVTQDENGQEVARDSLTQAEQDALEYARQNGVLVVVAAGNDGMGLSALAQSATQFDNVLTVGAVEDDNQAAYSNTGAGLGILANGGTAENPLTVFPNSDEAFFGTSAAAAQVSGAASRIWDDNPDLSYRQVIDILQTTATDLDADGWDANTGYGVLDLDAALEKAGSVQGQDYEPDAADIIDSGHDSGHDSGDIDSGDSLDSETSIERPLMNMPMGHMQQIMKLVPTGAATHTAVNSGSWFDPKTWGGKIPGNNARIVIPKGTTVSYDGESNARLFTVRVDGNLTFASNQDTRMLVDTMVVMTGGQLNVGSRSNPVRNAVTTDIVFAPVNTNNRLLNKSWDSAQVSRGLIAMKDSSVDVWGAEKTPYITLKNNARAGDRSLTFDRNVPGDWKVGDRVVLTGTAGDINWKDNGLSHDDNSFFEDEELTITGIKGNTITFKHNDANGNALRFNHLVPQGYGLDIYVANLTRNVRFSTEAGEKSQTDERGHIMFMDQDVEFHNAGLYDMGRSNKDKLANPNTNPRGRYPIHFHETLRHSNGYNESAARVTGNAIDGSLGWGYVVHGSKAIVEDNVSFDVLGAHYVTEDGDEIAEFRRNIAIKAEGASSNTDVDLLQLHRSDRGVIRDLAVQGYGFWLDSPYSAFALEDNIVTSTKETAYLFYGHNDNEFIEDKRGENFKTPTPGLVKVPVSSLPQNLRHVANGDSQVHAWKVPNPGPWSGNTAYNSESGAEIRGVLRDDNGRDSFFGLNHNTRATIDNFDIWGVRHFGLGVGYASNINVKDSLILGDLNQPLERRSKFVGADKQGMYGHGLFLAKNSRYTSFINNRVEGFEVGASVQQTSGQGLHLASEPNVGPGQLIGGYFANNTYNLAMAPGRDGDGASDNPMYFNNPFNPYTEISGDLYFEAPSNNKAPVAKFSLSSGGSGLTFNGKASIDPDYPVSKMTNNRNTIASYAWDFNNDGVSDDWGWTVNRNLGQGRHTVSLTVYDEHGASSTNKATIQVTGGNGRIISQTGSVVNSVGRPNDSGIGSSPSPSPIDNPPIPTPTPLPIPTPLPTPSPTPIMGDSSVTFQAENARLNGATVRTKSSAEGNKFVDFQGADGAFIEWSVDMAQAGDYDLSWRYTLGSGDRPLALSVNGKNVESSLDFPKTANWNTWSNLNRRLDLQSGKNTIRLTAIGQSGGDFDSLTITPVDNGAMPTPTPTPDPVIVPDPIPTPVPSPIPAPAPTPSVDAITMQAEDARLKDAVVRQKSGADGGEFVDFRGQDGAFIEWSVDMAQTGSYDLSWRYSLGSGDRPLALSVNGKVVEARLDFSNTKDWDTWDNLTRTLDLKAGKNTIRLTAIGKSGGDFDSLTITPATVTIQPIDPTPTPAPAPAPVIPATPTVTRLQAESANLNGAVVRKKPGVDGQFVDYRQQNGAFIEWSVDTKTAGDYDLAWRYSLGEGKRPLDLAVNGQTVERLDFQNTPSWDDWELLTRSLNLEAGQNTIRLTATGSSGGDFDYLEVSRSA